MLCAISGEAPQVPVASRKSGNVFERRLIESYIAENGTDPITNEELTVEDLVDLRTSRTVKPRPPQFTSIPSLLSAFQNEWDALALESYSTKSQLEQTRKELSKALYENDAAVRVIARLQKERDEARDALSKLSIGGSGSGGRDTMQVDGQELHGSLQLVVADTQKSLSATRRKRPVPKEWATPDVIGSYKVQKRSKMSGKSPGFLQLHQDGDLLLAPGNNGTAEIYSVSQGQHTNSFAPLDQKAATGLLSDGLWSGDSIIVASRAGTIELRGAANAICRQDSTDVAAIALHPSGRILASAGLDKNIVLYDVQTMAVATRIHAESALAAVEFHPDGHIVAAGGVDGEIKLFDVTTGEKAAAFDAKGPVECLSFSENGTWLAASVGGDSSVQIWDLRKTAIVKTLTVGGAVRSVKWDYTGQFLAVSTSAGVEVHHYNKGSKVWSECLTSSTASSALAWGANARSLYCLDMSGTLFELA